MSGRDSVTPAMRKAALAAFARRQADQQRLEAKEAAGEEAIYRKVRADGGDATRQVIREALAASVKAEQEAERARQAAAARRAVATKPGPGRRPWPTELFHEHYREAIAATKPPRTPGRVAANFRRLDGTPGIEPDSLARLLRQHGRPTDTE